MENMEMFIQVLGGIILTSLVVGIVMIVSISDAITSLLKTLKLLSTPFRLVKSIKELFSRR